MRRRTLRRKSDKHLDLLLGKGVPFGYEVFGNDIGGYLGVFISSSGVAKPESRCWSFLCKTLNSKILAPRTSEAKDHERLREILTRWQVSSLEQYRQDHSENNPNEQVFVFQRNRHTALMIYGTLAFIDLKLKDRSLTLLAIRDFNRRLHLIDGVEDLRVARAPSQSPESRLRHGDTRWIKNFLDKNYHTENIYQYTSAEKINSSLTERQKQQLSVLLSEADRVSQAAVTKEIYDSLSPLISVATFSSIVFWGGSAIWRVAFPSDFISKLLNHTSNFYFGLIGMSLINNGFRSHWPSKVLPPLVLAIGMNLGLNIYEEVDFGKGRAYHVENQKGTDTRDLASGLLSTLPFLASVAAIEARVQSKCKRLPPGGSFQREVEADELKTRR